MGAGIPVLTAAQVERILLALGFDCRSGKGAHRFYRHPDGRTTTVDHWIYVLHCFQKKSTKGIETPKPNIDLIKSRLQDAQEDHAAWSQQAKGVRK